MLERLVKDKYTRKRVYLVALKELKPGRVLASAILERETK
jgi:hypothetical protein